MNRQPNRVFKIKHINIQSLKPKIHLVKNFLAATRTDILSVNETWLKPSDEILIENYSIIRFDRLTGGGGGVCLIIHNSISYTKVLVSNCPGTDHVTIRVHDCIRGKKDLYLTSLYVPPKINMEPNYFLKFLEIGENALLLGDLNAHHELWKSNKNNNIGNIIVNLQQQDKLVMLNNDQPTYEPLHRLSYKAILDFALGSNKLRELVSQFSVTDELRSDHLSIQLSLDTKNHKFARPHVESKVVTKINWHSFDRLIKQQIPADTNCNTIEGINLAVLDLTSKIQSATEESTETRTIQFNPDQHLQLPRFILDKIKEKRKLERQLKQSRNGQLKTLINKLGETITHLINKHNGDKWKRQCTALNNYRVSDTKLWRKLEAIENSTRPRTAKNPTILINGTPVSDPRIVAEHFACKQKEIFTEPTDPDFDEKFKETVDAAASTLFLRNEQADQPVEASLDEVNAIIKQLKHHKAPGPDKINNSVIKRLPNNYRQAFTMIANASIKLNYFPSIWKEATMVMVPKPLKDSLEDDNYRPISLLCTLSKVLERIIQTRMRSWIENNNLLSKYQCGFRNFRQTKDQIIRMIQNALTAFNTNEIMGAVFIDIEKAFDKVWHKGLLYELENLKIPSYLGKWLQSYLTGRYFKIRINNIFSSSKLIEAGVPQGSVLGPTLFNYYFNKIANCILFNHLDPPPPKPASLALFADDLASWAKAKKLEQIRATLQAVLNNIEAWMNQWRTKVSIKKTICIVFNKGGKNLGSQLKLTYKNKQIASERNPKFLGVTLDPSLSLRQYTQNTVERAQKRINLIKSIKGKRWGASSKLIMTTYNALVRPILEYVPYATLILSDSNYIKLERIQRAAVRKAYYWAWHRSTNDIYKEHNIQSIKNRAIHLTDKYICTAYHSNIIIKELIDDYNILSEFDEGAHCHSAPRITILGKIKQFQVNCCAVLKATTQTEQMTIYQQQYINSDES